MKHLLYLTVATLLALCLASSGLAQAPVDNGDGTYTIDLGELVVDQATVDTLSQLLRSVNHQTRTTADELDVGQMLRGFVSGIEFTQAPAPYPLVLNHCEATLDSAVRRWVPRSVRGIQARRTYFVEQVTIPDPPPPSE